jgi:peptidoglycan/xylan/chitin deacetylase (PgdA/CDA1 family)
VRFRLLAVSLLLALVFPSLASPAGVRTVDVPILMYHRIDFLKPTLPAITRRLTVDPGDFARQMEWLKGHGYHSLTQEQLLAALRDGRALPSKPVLITFDDGYRDVLGKASPVLHRLHMHATEYVITDRLHGTDPSFLTVPQLRVLEQRGVEIGSHTVTHVDLPTLGDAQVMQELTASKRTLERAVRHPVLWFSYPAGAYDSRVVGLVARAGYQLAVTTQPGACQSSARPLELERFEVLDSTGVAGLAAILRGARC